MKLFVDDIRNPPFDWRDWYTCRTIAEAQAFLKSNKVLTCSLDHDMPDADNAGLMLAKWMCTNSLVPDLIGIHSANGEAAKNMKSVFDSYNKVFNTNKIIVIYDYKAVIDNNIPDIELWRTND